MTRRITNDDIASIEKLSKFVSKLSKSITDECCKDLDDLMQEINSNLMKIQPMNDRDLEYYILELANVLYFVGEKLEEIGIKEDVSKAKKVEVYNTAKLLAVGTVAEKDAEALTKAQKDTIVYNVFNRSYKKTKLKIDSGYEMLNSLKKIMNKRLLELELSNSKYISKNREVF